MVPRFSRLGPANAQVITTGCLRRLAAGGATSGREMLFSQELSMVAVAFYLSRFIIFFALDQFIPAMFQVVTGVSSKGVTSWRFA